MKAAVLRATGDENLDVVDHMQTIDVGPGQVKVALKASGICHTDLSAMNGTMPMPAPVVLGHEGAGVVSEVGDGVTHLQVGDHVIIQWNPPCGECDYCTVHHRPHLCRTGLITGSMTPNFREGDTLLSGFTGAGTFSEELVTNGFGAVKIPDEIPFDVAALIGCGVTTGVGAAINRAQVKPASTVVVFGCGGVGISAIQGAKVCGAAEIVAVDLNRDKLEEAKRFGATHGVTPDELEAAKQEITSGTGFDYAFEAVGIPLTMRAAYDAVRMGGTVVIIGAGNMTNQVSFSTFELFYDEKSILGSYYGSDDPVVSFRRILRLWKAGRLDLEGMITRKLKIDDINDAIHAMDRGETVRQIVEF